MITTKSISFPHFNKYLYHYRAKTQKYLDYPIEFNHDLFENLKAHVQFLASMEILYIYY